MLEVDASLGGFDPQRAEQLYRTLNDRLAALPGVQHVSISATAPVWNGLARQEPSSGPACTWARMTSRRRPRKGSPYSSRYNSIGADYFATMGIPILRGRNFTVAEATQPNSPPVAIIDEALAKKLWPEGDALGQRIQFAPDAAPRAKRDDGGRRMGIHQGGKANIKQEEPIEVVGIAAVTRGGVFENGRGARFMCRSRAASRITHFSSFNSRLSMRTTVTDIADAIRRAVRETDPTLPVLALKTFPQHLDANMQTLDHPHRRDSLFRLRRTGAASRDRRRLWRESLLGGAADP